MQNQMKILILIDCLQSLTLKNNESINKSLLKKVETNRSGNTIQMVFKLFITMAISQMMWKKNMEKYSVY